MGSLMQELTTLLRTYQQGSQRPKPELLHQNLGRLLAGVHLNESRTQAPLLLLRRIRCVLHCYQLSPQCSTDMARPNAQLTWPEVSCDVNILLLAAAP